MDFIPAAPLTPIIIWGAHLTQDGAVFRTFAPSAQKISLIGEFSNWEELPMAKVYDGNFWERIVPQAKPGMKYKYRHLPSRRQLAGPL